MQLHQLQLMFGREFQYQTIDFSGYTEQQATEDALIAARQQFVDTVAVIAASTDPTAAPGNKLFCMITVQPYNYLGTVQLCDPIANQQLRRKYCEARQLYPLTTALLIQTH